MRVLILAIVLCVSAGGGQADRTFTGDYFPYRAFDALTHDRIEIPGATLVVGFAPGRLSLPEARVRNWIERAANIVSSYYGRFPVKSARILIVPQSGKGIHGGTAWGWYGAALRVMIGERSTEADLARDWRLIHEMVHFALPNIPHRHNWLSEGLAVYVESIARAKAGDLPEEAVWGTFVRDMPQGLPLGKDRGLDRNASWGNTYWGGTIFCLLADIEIRKRTDNRLGLQDAMRGVLKAGGDHEQDDWPLLKILETADRVTGHTVLADLYRTMGRERAATDLDALWKRLGVDFDGDRVIFDDDAELAHIRQAITERNNAAETGVN